MQAYEHLSYIVMHDDRTMELIDRTVLAIRSGFVHPSTGWVTLADRVCAMHNMSAEIYGNAVVFYHLTSRAKHPACMVVSMNAGQAASPSAGAFRKTANALIQVFDGDADDSDVATEGPAATHRVETKGRVLLH